MQIPLKTGSKCITTVSFRTILKHLMMNSRHSSQNQSFLEAQLKKIQFAKEKNVEYDDKSSDWVSNNQDYLHRQYEEPSKALRKVHVCYQSKINYRILWVDIGILTRDSVE